MNEKNKIWKLKSVLTRQPSLNGNKQVLKDIFLVKVTFALLKVN